MISRKAITRFTRALFAFWVVFFVVISLAYSPILPRDNIPKVQAAGGPVMGFFSPERTWTAIGNANLNLRQPDPRNGDLMVASIAIRPSASTVNTPSGWNALGHWTATDGGSEAADAGSVGYYWFYKVSDGTEGTSNVTFTENGTTSVWTGSIMQVRSATGTYSLSSGANVISGNTTSWSGVLDTDIGLTAGDLVLMAGAQVGNAATMSAEDISATGVTSKSTVVEAGEFTSNTGNDIDVALSSTLIWAGTNSVTPTISSTPSVAVSGINSALRIRQGSGTNRTDTFVRSAGSQVAGTTSLAVPYPEHEVGDMLVLIVGNKYSTATPATPSGWNSLGTFSGGTSTNTTDSGSARTTAFYEEVTSLQTGTQSVTITSGNASVGEMFAIHKESATSWSFDSDGGGYSGATTSWSVTGAGIDLDSSSGGDVVLAGNSVNTDSYTYSGFGMSASGITFGDVTETSEYRVTNGSDMTLEIVNGRVTAGSANNVALTYTSTASGSVASTSPEGASMFIKVKGTASTGVTVSGTIYSDAGTNALDCSSARTVSIRVNGAGTYSGSCSNTPSTGSFSIPNIVVLAGSTVTVFLDGATEKAVTVTRAADSSTDITVNLWQNYVIVQHEDAGPITDTDLGQYDSNNDSDIQYAVSAGALTVASGNTLEIAGSDTFTPGGSVSTPAMNVDGTLSGSTDVTVSAGGITGNGTVNMSGGTFLQDGTGSFGGNTGWTFNNLTFGDGTGTTTTTATGSGSITVNGSETIAANQTLDAGSKTWNLNGIPASTGTFTAVQSAFGQANTPADTTISASLTGVTAGDLIVVWVGSEDTPSVTVTVNDGSSDLTANPITSAGDGNDHAAQSFYLLSANGGDRTYTATFSHTRSYRRIFVWEFSHTGNVVALDAESANSATSGTAVSSGSITTTDANDLVVAGEYNHAGDTKTSPLINGVAADNIIKDSPENYGSMWYKIESGTFSNGTASVTQSTSTTWISDVVAFKTFTSDPLTVSGTFTASTSTVNFGGTSAVTIPALTYNNLGFVPASGTPTYTAAGAITANGNLTIGDGTHAVTFVAPSGNLSVGGNFTNSASATFTHNSGTVIVTGSGTHSISSSSSITFNNFQDTTAGNTLTFKNDAGGSTPLYTFAGTVTITGATGNHITITSDNQPTNKWMVHFNNATSTITHVTVSYSDCDGTSANATLDADSTDGTNNGTCYIFSGNSITISGIIYSDAGSTAYDCSANNLTVAIKVNGAGAYSGTCTLNTGAFSVPTVTVSGGSVVTVFLDGETEKAVTITRALSSVADITTANLWQSYVILQHEDSGPITNNDLDSYDSGNDADIQFTVTGGNLTVATGNTLEIAGSDTFTPGGTVSTPALHIDGTLSGTDNVTVSNGTATGDGTINLTGGTFLIDGAGSFGSNTGWIFNNLTIGDGSGTTTTTANGSGSITVTGSETIAANQTLDAGSKTWVLNGSGVTVNGIFTASTSTVNFSGTSATTIPALTYNNLAFIPGSGSPTYTLASGTLAANGSTTIGDGIHAVTVTAATNNPTINLLGNFTIASNATYTKGSGTTTFKSGSTQTWTDNTAGQDLGSVSVAVNTTNTTLNLAGTPAATSVTVNSSQTLNGGSATLVLAGTGTPLVVNGTFTPSSGTVAYTGTTANLDAITYNALTLGSGTYTAPAGTMTITGDFTNNGTFTHNNGTVDLEPISTSQVTGTSNTTFYNLTSTAAGKTIQFKNGSTVTVANQLNLTGNANTIYLKSTSDGSQWTLNLQASSNGSVMFVSVKDAACSGNNISTPNDSIHNLGNNGSCWGFVSFGGGGAIGGGGGGGSGGGTPASGGGSITIIQSNGVNLFNPTNISVTLTGVTAGNVIVVFATNANGAQTLNSFTDTQGNSYTFGDANIALSTAAELSDGWAIASSSGDITVTAHFAAGTGSRTDIVAIELSGADSSSPLDAHNATTYSGNAGTDAVTFSLTTSAANTLVLGAIVTAQNGTVSAGTGYSSITVNGTSRLQFVEYRTQATAATFNVTSTTSAFTQGVLGAMAFKPASQPATQGGTGGGGTSGGGDGTSGGGQGGGGGGGSP